MIKNKHISTFFSGLTLVALLVFSSCTDATEGEFESGKPPKIPVSVQDTFPEVELEVVQMAPDFGGRALQAMDSNTFWFAGPNGLYGYSEDGGENWILDSVKVSGDTAYPSFRAMSVVGNKVFLMNIGSPARIFKSSDKGNSWDVVFEDSHPEAFYDAMKFWNESEGIAIGDPQEGCLTVVVTRDSGNTWTKISCEGLPATDSGEAAYAASNSNIAIFDNHTWIATGGTKSRVLYSPDKGNTWQIFKTPIVQGASGDGIYSIDFFDEHIGVGIGGNWEHPERNAANQILTTDGGKLWITASDGEGPGYSSCIKYINAGPGGSVLTTGPGGTWICDNILGYYWRKISDERFYAIEPTEGDFIAILIGKSKFGKLKLKRAAK